MGMPRTAMQVNIITITIITQDTSTVGAAVDAQAATLTLVSARLTTTLLTAIMAEVEAATIIPISSIVSLRTSSG